MNVEEVERRKREAEEAISNILQNFVDDTCVIISEIEVMRRGVFESNGPRIIARILLDSGF